MPDSSGWSGRAGVEPAEALDDLAHASHRPRDVVGDDDPEVVFEREEEVRRIEGVDAELLECGGGGETGGIEMLAFRDDFDYPPFKIV
jgi:hypothetical protein